MNKKQKLMTGITTGVAVVSIGGYYFMSNNSAKVTFLSRTKAATALKQVSQNFEIKISSSQLPQLGNLRLSGTSNTDKEHADVTLSISGIPGIHLNDFHIVTKGQDVYIDASSMMTYYSQLIGFDHQTNLSGQYININDLPYKQLSSGGHFASNAKLQEEINQVLANYLTKLGGNHFKMNGDDAILTLDKTELKQLMVKTIDTMTTSKHYNGDKTILEEAKKAIKDLDNFLQDGKLDLSISQGKVTGNTKLSVNFQSQQWGDFDANMSTTVKEYQAPKNVTNIMPIAEFEKTLQEAAQNHFLEEGDLSETAE